MHSNGSDIITWGITTRKWVKNQGLISFTDIVLRSVKERIYKLSDLVVNTYAQ